MLLYVHFSHLLSLSKFNNKIYQTFITAFTVLLKIKFTKHLNNSIHTINYFYSTTNNNYFKSYNILKLAFNLKTYLQSIRDCLFKTNGTKLWKSSKYRI